MIFGVDTSENADLGYTSGEQAITITDAVDQKSLYLAWEDTFSNGSDLVQITDPQIVTTGDGVNLYYELGRNAEINWTLAVGVRGIFVDAPSPSGGFLDSIDLVSVGIGLAIGAVGGAVGGGLIVKTIWPSSWAETLTKPPRESQASESQAGTDQDYNSDPAPPSDPKTKQNNRKSKKTGRNPQTGREFSR